MTSKKISVLLYLLPLLTLCLEAQTTTLSLGTGNTTSVEQAFSNLAGSPLKVFGVDMVLSVDTPKESQVLLKEGEKSTVQTTGSPLGSAQYRLGPGDQVSFFLWGESIDVVLIQNPDFPLVQTLTVSNDGAILYPGVGRFDVRGRSLSEVRELVRVEMVKKYKKFDLGISLVQPRNQQIWITGYVKQPGQREIPPNSSLLEALAVAGGPSEGGSMRNITVYRSTTDETFKVDLYPLLLGENTQVLSLVDGDRVMVGAMGTMVAISGAVLRPAIYEFLTPPDLKQLVSIAGGKTPFATDYIKVIKPEGLGFTSTTVNDSEPIALQSGTYIHIPGRETNLSIASKLGDYVSEFPILVGGAVVKSGFTSVNAGSRISDALALGGGYAPDAFPEGLVLLRQSVREAQIQQTAKVVAQLELQRAKYEGQLQAAKASNAPLSTLTQLNEAITKLAQSISEVKSVNVSQYGGRISLQIPATLEALKADVVNNIVLEPGDTLFVPKRPSFVLVMGSIHQQNSFPYRESKRVKDYVAMAGGANATGNIGETYLIKANGQVRSANSTGGFLWFKPDPLEELVGPGDAIIIPERTVEVVDWLEGVEKTLSVVNSLVSTTTNTMFILKSF